MKPSEIPILRMGSTLIVSLQVELRDTVADAFQAAVLQAIEHTDAQGLLIDISALDLVDSYVARILSDTGKMARLMGTATVLVGMRPEVAATLVRMGYLMTEIRTALNVEEGLALLSSLRHRRLER